MLRVNKLFILVLFRNLFSPSVLDDFNIHVCQESIRTSLVNSMKEVKIFKKILVFGFKYVFCQIYISSVWSSLWKYNFSHIFRCKVIHPWCSFIRGFCLFVELWQKTPSWSCHIVSSNYFQKFEEGYYATDFHGSNLIIPEDNDPYAWYCLTLNIRELDDATAVVKNIQQGDILPIRQL